MVSLYLTIFQHNFYGYAELDESRGKPQKHYAVPAMKNWSMKY